MQGVKKKNKGRSMYKFVTLRNTPMPSSLAGRNLAAFHRPSSHPLYDA